MPTLTGKQVLEEQGVFMRNAGSRRAFEVSNHTFAVGKCPIPDLRERLFSIAD